MTGLFGSTPSIPAPPPVQAPPPMPDPNGPAAQEAARVAATKAMAGGRSATVLTTAANRARGTVAGGGSAVPYSNSTLGGAK